MHLPKKRFGQHFLRDQSIAKRICDSLLLIGKDYNKLLEIGPGQGVLTQYLYPLYSDSLYLVEIDRDLVPSLKKNYPLISEHIFQQDFLELSLDEIFSEQVGVIGNFPYNISSQILFKVVEHRDIIPEMVGMFQREVAQRVMAEPGNKIYGLISVWVQTFYHTDYLFTVKEGSFNPPPKVKSGVIRLTRKEISEDFDPKLLLQVIKSAFNQRRKTLRNALKPFMENLTSMDSSLFDKRAEQLSWEDYILICKAISENKLK